jgi:hypothetical protein
VVKVLSGRPVASGGQRSSAVRGLDSVQFAAQASHAFKEQVSTCGGLGVDWHPQQSTREEAR